MLAGVALAVFAGVPAHAAVVESAPRRTPTFNGTVYAAAYRGDVVYVGGAFTSALVDGRLVGRQRLAAVNIRTGELLPWAPAADNTVRALAVDGDSVYAAGDFSLMSGLKRDSLARLNASTGAVGSFKHTILGAPAALVAGHGRLYVGGRLTGVDGFSRANLAAFSLDTGALDHGWAPTTDDQVTSLALGHGRVYLGGRFHRTNDVSGSLRLTAVDPYNGVLDKTFLPKPGAGVYAVAVDADGVYAAQGGQGGRAAAYTTAGKQRWLRMFDGDAQAIAVLDGVTYVGGHFDRACTTTATGTQGVCIDGSYSRIKFAAVESDGRLSSWAPQGNGVTGVYAMTASPSLATLAAGGAFTTVGGVTHKRFAVFA